MPLTTSTVSGYLVKPDGTSLASGVAAFTLSGSAASGEYITNTMEVMAYTDEDGFFSVELMPNSAYPYFSYYTLIGYDLVDDFGKRGNGYEFGNISVPDLDADIADLIPLKRSTRNTYYLHKGDSFDTGITMIDSLGSPVDISDSNVSAYLEFNGEVVPLVAVKSSQVSGLVELTITSAVSSSLKCLEYTMVVMLSVGSRVNTLRSKLKVI